MRRVYYAFALRMATHPLLIHVALLVLSVFALSRLTHVSAIVNNIMSVKVGDLGAYLLSTFMHAEFLTLFCTGVVFFTLLSLPFRVSLPKYRTTQPV